MLVAIDDSKSMSSTSVSAFALESLALVCNAMAKLEISDMGVVRFGGEGGAELLHAFETPFSGEVGGEIVGKMRFDADNTIDDRPIVDLLEFVSGLERPEGVKQLVIIMGDGRFHEREALRKAVMDVSGDPSVMYAFVILGSGVLEMQTVEFVDGKPVFARYVDGFPFGLYVVVGEVRDLVWGLGAVVRGWMERVCGGG